MRTLESADVRFVKDLIESVDPYLVIFVLGVGLLYLLITHRRASQPESAQSVVELERRIEALERENAELRGRVTIAEQNREGATPQAKPKAEAKREPEKESPSRALEQVRSTEKPEGISPIARGMVKSRLSLLEKLKGLLGGSRSITAQGLDDLEELLISSDVGVRVSEALVGAVREQLGRGSSVTESELRGLLREGIRKELIEVPSSHRLYHPTGAPLVVLVVGVNGVGKTTTVAKLANRYREQGKRVLVIAADTFRAAAVEQLKEWATRGNFEVFSGPENAKPAAVVFDGIVVAKEKAFDVVLIDTAGRLHTKSNLMQELEGVKNSIRRHIPDAPHETVLVVDGVSGQNALTQAREFNASTPLTGLVVTKLDGSPKGGIVVAISRELKVPVLYVGVGEKAHDLIAFSVPDFIEGLLADPSEGTAIRLDPTLNETASRAGAI